MVLLIHHQLQGLKLVQLVMSQDLNQSHLTEAPMFRFLDHQEVIYSMVGTKVVQVEDTKAVELPTKMMETMDMKIMEIMDMKIMEIMDTKIMDTKEMETMEIMDTKEMETMEMITLVDLALYMLN